MITEKVYGTRWTCACCGREFKTPGDRLWQWGYAVGERACCSYRCMRDLDRQLRDQRMQRTGRSMAARMYEDWFRGMNFDELSDKWHRKPKDIITRMTAMEDMHPDVTEWIREKVQKERRGA